MAELPIKVRKALLKLRENHDHYVEVKVIKGLYCVFESTSSYDKDKKKTKKITHYLGRFSSEGGFTKAKHREPHAESTRMEPRTQIFDISEYDQKLLTDLSTDARVTYTAIGRKLGLTKNITYGHIKKLQKKYGLRYLPEINIGTLGYLGFFTFVKFKNEVPPLDEIKKILSQEPRVQLVALTVGEYQMLIYFLAQSSKEVAYFIYNLQTLTLFNKYIAEWYTTPDFPDFGFIPLRDESFKLIEEKVWKRSKESPRPLKENISQREFNVLRELNNNGAIDFTEIDKKYNLGRGAAQYTYHSLKEEKKILKNITINATTLPIKYNAIMIVDIINGNGFGKTRVELLKEIIQDNKLLNKYALVSDIELPHSVMFIMPVFSDEDLARTQDHIKSKLLGTEIRTLIITEIILGSLCYRRRDKYKSDQYKLLVDEYKIEDQNIHKNSV